MGLFKRRTQQANDLADQQPTVGGSAVGADPMAGAHEPAQFRTRLTTLVAEVNRAGGRLPEGAVPTVLEIQDALLPLITYIEKRPQRDVELIDLRALVDAYLPDTIDKFLDLPPQFTATHRNARGQTPAEEFVAQLHLLLDGTTRIATAIYAGDSVEVSAQRYFLQDKFGANQLDNLNTGFVLPPQPDDV